ncbi:hypothetical protein VN0138_10780 [Helicobacter pylori]
MGLSLSLIIIPLIVLIVLAKYLTIPNISLLLEFSENIPKAPNEIPQFLTNFKNSKIHNEKISFSPPKDYPSLYKVYGYFKREVRDTFDRYLWHG